MAEPQWTRRVEVRLRNSTAERASKLTDMFDTDCSAVIRESVHLRAGEKARPITVHNRYPGTPRQGLLMVATDRPGVIVRIAPNNTTKTCRNNGYVCPASAEIFRTATAQDGTVVDSEGRYWRSGYWLDNWHKDEGGFDVWGAGVSYANNNCQKVSDPNFVDDVIGTTGNGFVSSAVTPHTGLTPDISEGALVTGPRPGWNGRQVSVAKMIWSATEYQDLGNDDDGKILSWWTWLPNTKQDVSRHVEGRGGTSPGLVQTNATFRCYPYSKDETDDEAYTGTQNIETDISPAIVGGPARSARFIMSPRSPQTEDDHVAKLKENTWSHMIFHKNDFTPYEGWLTSEPARRGRPRWDRITSMQFGYQYSPVALITDAPTMKISSVYFGDPPGSRVDHVSIFDFKFQRQDQIVISLDAPGASDANVELLGAIADTLSP